jgi:hypothetical protein
MGHQNHRRLRRRRLQLFRMRNMPATPSKPNRKPKEKLLTYTPPLIILRKRQPFQATNTLKWRQPPTTTPPSLPRSFWHLKEKTIEYRRAALPDRRRRTVDTPVTTINSGRARKRVLLVFVAGYVVPVSHVNQWRFLCAAYFPDLDWASCVESASRRRINWTRNLPWDDRFASL